MSETESDIVMPNDQCVRSNPMTPMSMSSVSWFEFLLDEHRLDNHLQQENPGNFIITFTMNIYCNRNVQYNIFDVPATIGLLFVSARI